LKSEKEYSKKRKAGSSLLIFFFFSVCLLPYQLGCFYPLEISCGPPPARSSLSIESSFNLWLALLTISRAEEERIS
jgi:hypothetical protein